MIITLEWCRDRGATGYSTRPVDDEEEDDDDDPNAAGVQCHNAYNPRHLLWAKGRSTQRKSAALTISLFSTLAPLPIPGWAALPKNNKIRWTPTVLV
jgi:hypothetical protein